MVALHVPSRTPPAVVPDTTVEAARRGDERAFAALYDAYAPRVFPVLLGLAGDRVAATELLQDTFVRVWEGLRSFRGEAAFGSWVHRIAVNTALESRRSDGRRSLRVRIAADFAEERPAALDGPAAPRDSGLAMDLEGAILRLPAGARAVFVLHDVEGYGHAEIGERLGIAEGTSRAHLFRARRLLRESLDR